MPQDADLALDRLCTAVQHAQQQLDDVLARAAVLRAGRARSQPYVELVSEEQRPLVVELLSSVLEELAAAGAAFRRAEARVLHADGLSQEAIGRLFGVTRQRVSVLLQDSSAT